MVRKIAAGAGAITGWGGAVTLMFLDSEGTDVVMAQAGLLSLGILGCAWLMLCAWRRPIGETYAYAYQLGRAEALRELAGPDGGGRVVPLRRATVSLRCDDVRAFDA